MARYIAPIDRSISPSVITNTSPIAMIPRKQKYGSRFLKFANVKKSLVVTPKYTIAAIVTTMMLPSRSASTRVIGAITPADRRFGGDPEAGASAGVCEVAAIASERYSTRRPLRLLDARRRARALVAALGRAVRDDRRLVQELQASVDVGGAGQPL